MGFGFSIAMDTLLVSLVRVSGEFLLEGRISLVPRLDSVELCLTAFSTCVGRPG